jgi:nitrite reductase/ring-hydroxylating ferredoxin subunit
MAYLMVRSVTEQVTLTQKKPRRQGEVSATSFFLLWRNGQFAASQSGAEVAPERTIHIPLPLFQAIPKIAVGAVGPTHSGGISIMAFTKVAATTEVPPGNAKRVTVNNRTVGVFNVAGTFYAIEDVCTHRGGPLSEGTVQGTEVTCPWHGARFDLTTGAHLCPPAPRGVPAFKVQVVGDEVQVDVG